MNWKLIIVGGLVFFIATWIVGFATGFLIHEVVLDEAYRATEDFWQPALREDPPDLAALMPRWIGIGLLSAFVTAAIYGWIRSSFNGPGWKKGLQYGLMLWLLIGFLYLGLSGVFYLPNEIWLWWIVDALVLYCLGGAALGWFAERWAPAG